jgi:hypothetical protein
MNTLRFLWHVAFYLSAISLAASVVHFAIFLWRVEPRGTRHAWYTPSAWVSTLLFEVARRAPNEAGMVVAGLYGLVEVCGLMRVAKILFAQRELIAQALFRRKNVS